MTLSKSLSLLIYTSLADLAFIPLRPWMHFIHMTSDPLYLVLHLATDVADVFYSGSRLTNGSSIRLLMFWHRTWQITEFPFDGRHSLRRPIGSFEVVLPIACLKIGQLGISSTQGFGSPITSACLMTLPAACLLRLKFSLDFAGPASAALIFSKYCLTRVSSRKTGCSFACTPFNRRYAIDHINERIALV